VYIHSYITQIRNILHVATDRKVWSLSATHKLTDTQTLNCMY